MKKDSKEWNEKLEYTKYVNYVDVYNQKQRNHDIHDIYSKVSFSNAITYKFHTITSYALHNATCNTNLIYQNTQTKI